MKHPQEVKANKIDKAGKEYQKWYEEKTKQASEVERKKKAREIAMKHGIQRVDFFCKLMCHNNH